jgi:hypothetical protein
LLATDAEMKPAETTLLLGKDARLADTDKVEVWLARLVDETEIFLILSAILLLEEID